MALGLEQQGSKVRPVGVMFMEHLAMKTLKVILLIMAMDML